ncbi:M3 family metallopeptidase [uncultured Draconibacterium sp.]|uniref:M3 family metallopeptidase n=1 Tax=uncultured Draconibacterium sp. TaxID=1573823 RepID=UPI002AA78B7B|nr:M3 family metallopeptidase [uncultured Draconibacterium sp.]
MKSQYYLVLFLLIIGCTNRKEALMNPFLKGVNVPIDYANVNANDIEEYANYTLIKTELNLEEIKKSSVPSFENLFGTFDDIANDIYKAASNCHMLYWVSPDSLSREKGLSGFQKLDSLSTTIYSDRELYEKMMSFKLSENYAELADYKKRLVDDLIFKFEQSGVNLKDEKLSVFKDLMKQINQLSSEYSNNMNASNEVLILDEQGIAGLSENFKNTYKTEENKYEVPVMNATVEPVLSNATNEETRKAFFFKYNNRASYKNLVILDSLVQKRYELAKIIGFESYAQYNLFPKMAKDPVTVWIFINDLVDKSKEKAKSDIELLNSIKKKELGGNASSIKPWDIKFYNNQILKTQYQVDHDIIREYLPLDSCLNGIFNLYEKLFGFEFRKVNNPLVWHKDVELIDVYEENNLKGRIYLDLFPRPNKESWFYGVPLSMGKATEEGYEVPINMLLGNFTPATEALPALLSFNELSTLFHEFGHIVDGISYHGEYSLQADTKPDFVESMSQIFENWIWNYEILSSFARHYETGEVLSKEIFKRMLNAKNVSSGLFAVSELRYCIYDMNLYDRYNPAIGINTDKLWQKIDDELDLIPMYAEGTHPQASWIHINTHPVYYYGYLWAEVYAQDMFTEFERNGLTDRETGLRFRELILANGTQRDIKEAVEEFLGRPSNSEAYIKNLGLN